MTAGATRWVSRREADRLARLLDGHDVPAASQELHALAALARELPRPAVTPDPAFVVRLRERLVADAAAAGPRPTTRPATRPATRPEPSRRDGPARPPRAVVVRVPRGLVTTVLATVAGLAVLLGGLSSRALPGGRLYDVKLGIGEAQVRLAGGDLARGRALLHQVDHRIDEVDALVSAGDPEPSDVDVALAHAADELADAQRVLLATDDGRPDPVALRALADATTQAQGRLDQLAPMLPTQSGPSLHHLLGLLADGTTALRRQVLVCGDACTALSGALAGPGSGSAVVPGAGAAPSAAAGSRPSAHGLPSVRVPTAVPTVDGGAGGGGPAPGGPAPGGGSGSGGGSTTATTGGGAGLPGVTASLPGVGVSLPGASVTTAPGGQPTITVPPIGVTLGPVTATVSTSGCVVGLGGICVGG